MIFCVRSVATIVIDGGWSLQHCSAASDVFIKPGIGSLCGRERTPKISFDGARTKECINAVR
jgi:hypothetical protein